MTTSIGPTKSLHAHKSLRVRNEYLKNHDFVELDSLPGCNHSTSSIYTHLNISNTLNITETGKHGVWLRWTKIKNGMM